MIRSSRFQVFFKIAILKSFANFTEKLLCWSLLLVNSVFLKNLRNFQEHLFYKTTPVPASELSAIHVK